MSRRNILPRACLLVVCAVVSSACGNKTSKPEGTPTADASSSMPRQATVDGAAAELVPADIKERGTITIASDASYAPFEYYDTDNKTMIGFDIDLTNAVTKTLGLKAKRVNASFDTILPGLRAGKHDVGASAFSVTAGRRATVDFVPYGNVGTGLAVLPGNPKKLTLDDLTSLCGHTITAQKGSTQGTLILPKLSKKCTAAKKPKIEIQLHPSQNDTNLAIFGGRADAIMADSAPLAYQAKQSSGAFQLAEGGDYDPTPLGLAVKNDSSLGPALAAAMQVNLDDGTIADLLKRWNLPDDAVPTSVKLVR